MMYSTGIVMLMTLCSLTNFVNCGAIGNETDLLQHFKFDLNHTIMHNKESNVNNTQVAVGQNATADKTLVKVVSLRSRFLKSRLLSIIQNLNSTISSARTSSEEFRKRLAASTESFTSKIHEDIQLLKAGVEQAVSEAIAKLQSKAVGVYECTQQQVGLADSWISTSTNNLGTCSVPLAAKAADAIANVTLAIEAASKEIDSVIGNLNSCVDTNNPLQHETCLSILLGEANGITFRLSSQLAYLLLQASRLVLTLPGTLASCGGSLLEDLNNGIAQAIYSISECTVTIMI